ncbi:retrovirus-related pol polyprotein from transposon TNT 1-94 [Tanacetum coccineum]
MNAIKPGMYRLDTTVTQTRTPQLPQTFRNTNPRISTSTGVIHRTSVSRPQLRSNQMKDKIVQIILFIVDSGCTKPMTGNLKLLCNFIEKYLGMGNDLLTGTRGSELYTISLQETSSPTPICFMAKASPTPIWLWHRRLSHLNFDTINLLSKKDIVNGLPKLKCVKDQLCLSCQMGKANRSTFKTKTVLISKGRLNLLHMDLCGPMRIESINGKKYIMVIVDNYSRYTRTHFLRSKDETPEVLKDFLKMIQRNLQAQNGVIERRNRTLVEAARTMLSASKLLLFFWAEAIATACYTKNRSLIIPRHEKTPYHIINDRKTTLKHLHIFGCICYITRYGENLDKMKEKGDPCILVGYSTQSKGYRVYNKSIELGIQDHNNELSSSKLVLNVVPSANTSNPLQQELDLLFSPMYEEYFTAGNHSMSNSFALFDNLLQDDTQPTLNVQPTLESIIQPTYVNTEENNTDQLADAQFKAYEFINPFAPPGPEVA